MSSKTVLALQTVNKHFHALASARVYCHVKFFLVAADAGALSGPAFRFSEGLHTLTTSSNDYVPYIKQFSLLLDPSDTEDNARKVACKYQHEEEPVKLLNTLLFLVLRNAKALESFQ